MRSRERAGTYADGVTVARTSAARLPLATEDSIPMQTSSTSRAGIGSLGIAMAAAAAAETASHEVTSRRGGIRSTTLEKRLPPTMYGRKPSAKVSEDRNADPVRL